MEKQYITQCPQCETSFKVSLAQMNKAQGLVRCGECMHVFSADQHLISEKKSQGKNTKQPRPTYETLSATPADKATTVTPTTSAPISATKTPRVTPDPKAQIPEIPLQIRQVDPRKPVLGQTLWGILFFISALGLMAQIAWFERNQLSQLAYLSQAYQYVCQHVDCKLSSRQDIPQIANHQLVVRDHPRYLGALTVDILMENQAPFPQPFPAIQLVFTDLRGEPKAARNVQPAEYLDGDFDAKNMMPSNKPVQVQIEILEPGAQALNYRLSFVQALNKI